MIQTHSGRYVDVRADALDKLGRFREHQQQFADKPQAGYSETKDVAFCR